MLLCLGRDYSSSQSIRIQGGLGFWGRTLGIFRAAHQNIYNGDDCFSLKTLSPVKRVCLHLGLCRVLVLSLSLGGRVRYGVDTWESASTYAVGWGVDSPTGLPCLWISCGGLHMYGHVCVCVGICI